jgi:ComF family protein
VYRYEGALKRAIGAGKHGGQERLWPLLAQLMGADEEARALAQEADALVPIPLAPHRRMSRGYNPSALLAQTLAQVWHKPVAHLLKHTGAWDQAPQSRLGATARQHQAAGAFVPVHPRAPLPGLRLLLVDDVITTGATLYAAAQSLGSLGADTVTAVALARQTREHGVRAPTPL